jgi:hypothetical protein
MNQPYIDELVVVFMISSLLAYPRVVLCPTTTNIICGGEEEEEGGAQERGRKG